MATNWKNFNPQTEREKFISEVVRRFGKRKKQIRDMLVTMKKEGELPTNVFCSRPGPERPLFSLTKVKGDKPFRMSVDVNEIKKDFDDEARIDEGLVSLGTHLIKDVDFRIELGISYERWKIISNKPKYDKNKKSLKGKRFVGLFWGQAPVIAELIKKIEML